MKVTTEYHPTPLVRVFATKFKAALQQPDYAALVTKGQGKFSLQSQTDPQAITVAINSNELHLSSGVDSSSDIVIHLNFAKPNASPQIKGLLRHPFYASAVGKLLEFPEVNWADALKQLWDQHKNFPGMPDGITAKSTDEDRQLSVGGSDEPVYLEGNAANLAEVFSGGSTLLQLLFEGKIKGQYRFQHVVVLSDVTLQMMLGED
ncbi:MAG: hypothetical protein ACJAR0_002667 [Candidatus Azotimanducaceae bacterium]|jgi:hypothetical protein